MSTRANILLTESYTWKDAKGKEKTTTDTLYFYRHSDGYPEGTLPTLNIFMDWLKNGKIRPDLQQCGGWLIMLGALEYNTIPKYKTELEMSFGREIETTNISTIEPPNDWKVGAYEPTTAIHGDIEYLYTVNLTSLTIEVKKVNFGK